LPLDTIYGANNKDWVQFSKHMPEAHAEDIESRKDVERQWDEDEYLTKYTDKPEFLGVIRKSDCAVVLWKLKTTINDEEYLERLILEEKNSKMYQIGIWTD
jgi:hypothetical protein